MSAVTIETAEALFAAWSAEGLQATSGAGAGIVVAAVLVDVVESAAVDVVVDETNEVEVVEIEGGGPGGWSGTEVVVVVVGASVVVVVVPGAEVVVVEVDVVVDVEVVLDVVEVDEVVVVDGGVGGAP